jgi:hypothetical protein
MDKLIFNEDDLKQIQALGITAEQVKSQIEIFKKGPSYLKLNRPCTIGDGITKIPESQIEEMVAHHHEAAHKGRLLKFVPASGAASRMFKTLLKINNEYEKIGRDEIVRKAKEGDQTSIDFLSFIDGIRNFAFFNDLKSVMGKDGLDADSLIEKGQFKDILEYLLTDRGLNYANLPKGLLKFHSYSEGSRTAMEEHLIEAAEYVRDAEGICRLHFTVSPEHQERFIALLDKVKLQYEKKYNVKFQVRFSQQKPSTDTIAVDMNNQPFREEDGKLLFRPGGHGALIENLNDIKGDIIYIKNIDNVVPDRLKSETFLWKKVLGGYLSSVQKKIFDYLEKLAEGGIKENFLDEVLEFAKNSLYILPPGGKEIESVEGKRGFLFKKLNRPLRVCGMVKNEGEPGGGPFWVEGKDGSLSLQIVESAQVNMESKEQKEIWNSSTHFNPVDIVCGVRDYKGNPFNLRQYVDPEAVFISRKSKGGRDLKALELPGLWNGAMADWISIFIEVPIITFNPVKTINDLLRKEHQPQ